MKERPRLGDRALALFGVRLVIWLIAARAFLPGVLTDPPYNIGYYHDEHGAIMEEETARRTLVEYGQAPAWNPWYCGGIFLTATSNAYAPDFLFRALFGTGPGRRLTALFFAIAGMEGVFRYARKNGASAIGASVGAVAFACSGHFKYLIGLGWTFMFNYNLLPWVALAFEKGLRSRPWMIAGGFLMAWLFVGGGTYAVPYAGLMLTLLLVGETLAALRAPDKRVPIWKPVAVLAGMGVFAVLFGAVRVLPVVTFISTHARGVEQTDLSAPTSVLAMLAFSRDHGAWGAGAGDFYVGTYVFLAAVIGGFLDRKAAKFALIALVFAAFACGEFVPNAPYVFMRKLPLFSQLRFPVRMLVVASLFVALAASRGFTLLEDALRDALERAWPLAKRAAAYLFEKSAPAATDLPLAARVAATAAASAIVAYLGYGAAMDVVEHNRIDKGTVFTMSGPQEWKDAFRQARGNRWDAHVWPFASRGTLHCFHEHKYFESPYLRGDLPNDEYPAPDVDTQVERISWSPNKIVVRVRGREPGRFLVNQNHDSGWRTDVGQLGSDGGLISVRVPAGEHVVTLSYRNGWMTIGAIVTGLTFAAVAFGLYRRVRKKVIALRRWYRALPQG